jgi:hypothetical protein
VANAPWELTAEGVYHNCRAQSTHCNSSEEARLARPFAHHAVDGTTLPTFSPGRLEVVSGAARARLRGGAGANLFARRQLFERIGRFDDAIGPGAPFRSCEEYDIDYRALRAGAKILRDPENAVLHWGKRAHRDGSSQRLLRDYQYGEGAVLAKHVRSGDLVALRLSLTIIQKELGFRILPAFCTVIGQGLILSPINSPASDGDSRRLFASEAAQMRPLAYAEPQ